MVLTIPLFFALYRWGSWLGEDREPAEGLGAGRGHGCPGAPANPTLSSATPRRRAGFTIRDAHLHVAQECPVTHRTPTCGLRGPRQQGEWQLCAGRPSGRKASIKQEVVLIPVSCHGIQSRRPYGTTFRNRCELHCSSARNDNVALCRRGSTVSTGGPVMPGASSCKGFLWRSPQQYI